MNTRRPLPAPAGRNLQVRPGRARRTPGGLLAALLLVAWPARAVLPPEHGVLPDFDHRPRVTHVSDAAQSRATHARATSRVPDLTVDLDPVLGTPAWVRSARGFLTAPTQPAHPSNARTTQLAPEDPDRALKGFLEEHRALFRHGPESLDGARVTRDSTSPHSGLRTVVWEQAVAGVPVFEGRLIAHTTSRGALAGVSSRFHPTPAQASQPAHGTREDLLALPPITAPAAIERAARSVRVSMDPRAVTPLDPEPDGPARRQRFQAPPLRGEVTARLAWLPIDDTELRLCWELLVTRPVRSELFRVLVDAQTGEVWLRQSLTRHAADAQFRVWTSDSPTPFSPGWTSPNTNLPPVVARQWVGTNGLDFLAGPLGWIDDFDNETRGNNVDAHLDLDDDNLPDLPRPQGSPWRVFDYPVNLALAPAANSEAAVVQLFYWCNWIHDRLYELGFTEAAGNFQQDNFGRGGVGGDAVQADAQDGGDVNNANFGTPPEGTAPRMQMHVFTPATPDRDACFDAEVVLHEYVHGLTERLVGGGVGISLLQSAGLAEGWSDFYALALLSEPGDDPHGVYPLGAYISHLLRGARDTYYFGIRRYPYCTDLTRNPLTFKDIDPVQASAHTGVPRNVIGGGAVEVHSQGEVWCMTLWEARARLVDRLGHAQGNRQMLEIVTDALSLSPPSPNFVQARDAVIQADLVLTGGANYRDLWSAFAKRGLGVGAFAPNAVTTGGVIESFGVPDDFLVRPAGAWLANGPPGGPFSPDAATFALSNLGATAIAWQLQHAPAWLTLTPTSSVLNAGAGGTVTAALAPAAFALPAGLYSDSIAFFNPTSGLVQLRPVILRVGQPDVFTEVFAANEFDLTFTTLTFVPDGSPGFYAACRKPASQFPTDPAGGQFLALTDDSSRLVALAGTNTVAIYGRRTNAFHVGSNGYLTFDRGDNSNAKSLENHFALPRVAALLEDLDPGAGGSVTWKTLSNRVAITFQQVPEFDQLNENNFQIELFFDGTLRLTWLRMDTRHGLAGLSAGIGVPLSFLESDLGAHGPCVETVGPLTLSPAPGGVLLQWPSLPGAAYRVQFKADLAAPQWSPLATTNATGSTTTLLDPGAAQAQRFYRVVQP